jgi:hypothetical protein
MAKATIPTSPLLHEQGVSSVGQVVISPCSLNGTCMHASEAAMPIWTKERTLQILGGIG